MKGLCEKHTCSRRRSACKDGSKLIHPSLIHDKEHHIYYALSLCLERKGFMTKENYLANVNLGKTRLDPEPDNSITAIDDSTCDHANKKVRRGIEEILSSEF